MRRSLLALVVVLVSLARATGADEEPRALSIFAAASLKEAFTEIAKQFEAEHEGMRVSLNLAGSQELRTQIENGAAADVFASADMRHMSALENARLVGRPQIFAKNEPVVVVPAENPAEMSKFEDLPNAKRLVIGTPEVPIGNYTLQILAKAAERLGADFAKRVEANVVSRELNVRQILAKVTLGEADAGFVYRTDALTAGSKVRMIEVPRGLNVIAEYPIAVSTKSERPEAARAWVELVLSERGQAALEAAGFRRAANRP